MATVNITVTGTQVGVCGKTFTFDATNSDKFMAFLAAEFGIADAAGTARTPVEMIEACCDYLRDHLIERVAMWETKAAAKAAAEAVQRMETSTESSVSAGL